MKRTIAALVLITAAASGQTQVVARKPLVRAFGEASITSVPDQAKISFAVDTRAATAQEAAAQNATISSAVITALQGVIGTNGDVQTAGYSLTAIYTYPPNGGQGTLSGFLASNTLQATLNNLAVVGRLIDSGIQAGANRVQSLTFLLKDPEPVRLQALKLAATKAKGRADAMASGAGMRAGAVLSIVEGADSTPVVYRDAAVAGASAATPVVPGGVITTATVTIEYELN